MLILQAEENAPRIELKLLRIHNPFMAWLVANQAQYGPALDDQSLLEPNSNPSVGDQRIDAIATTYLKIAACCRSDINVE